MDKVAQPGGGDAYEDIVRIGERIIDFQFRLVIDRLERTDRLIRLGVATLAGMIAVLGLLLAQGTVLDIAGGIGIGIGILMVAVAIYFLARLNTGLHRHQFVSLDPDLQNLYDKTLATNAAKNENSKDIAERMPIYVDNNMEIIRFLSSRQSLAVGIYGLSVALHATTIIFILGRHILA